MKKITSADFAPEMLECNYYDLDKYMTPFWKGNIVYNEAVFPITDENGIILPLGLMYEPTEIISVKDYTLTRTYKEGRDYALTDGKLTVIPTGQICPHHHSAIHPRLNPHDLPFEILYPHADAKGFDYWSESNEISLCYLSVTYIHNDTWHSITPESIREKLPRTAARLECGEPFTVSAIGDSVTAGAKSSRSSNLAPFVDAYPEMTVKALERKYGSKIEFHNRAVGGTLSTFYLDKVNDTVIQYSPDLVIIAYGMNDSSHERHGLTNEEFEKNIREHISYIKEKLPEAEVLLIASVYGNRTTFPEERYESHAGILKKIASDTEGVALCDPFNIEKILLDDGRKKFIDFMADNMVHPNDYGMRLIAQTIVEAFAK